MAIGGDREVDDHLGVADQLRLAVAAEHVGALVPLDEAALDRPERALDRIDDLLVLDAVAPAMCPATSGRAAARPFGELIDLFLLLVELLLERLDLLDVALIAFQRAACAGS